MAPVDVAASRLHVMTDSRFRELERSWRETGSDDAEVRLLTERLRAGRVSPAQLELAAYLGHQPSRAALDLPEDDSRDPLRWVIGLVRFGNDACFRAGLAVAREIQRGWKRQPRADGAEASALLPELVDAVVDAAEPCLVAATSEAVAQLEARARDLMEAWRAAHEGLPEMIDIIRRGFNPTSQDEPTGLIRATRAVVELPRLLQATEDEPGIPGLAGGALSTSLNKLVAPLDYQISRESLFQAIRAELLRWTLRSSS